MRKRKGNVVGQVILVFVVLWVLGALLKGCNDSLVRKQYEDCLVGRHDWSTGWAHKLYEGKVCDWIYCVCGKRSTRLYQNVLSARGPSNFQKFSKKFRKLVLQMVYVCVGKTIQFGDSIG